MKLELDENNPTSTKQELNFEFLISNIVNVQKSKIFYISLLTVSEHFGVS